MENNQNQNPKKGFSFIHEWLQKNTTLSDKVLELGCGPGQYSKSVNGKYFGCDLEFWLSKKDPLNIRKLDIVASSRWLPFTSESFDLIFSVASFYWVPGPVLALMDCHRVLKNEKKIILFDYTRKTLSRLAFKHYEEKIEHISIWTAKELIYLLKYVGFQNVQQLCNRPETAWKKLIYPIYKETIMKTRIHDMFEGWNIITGIK